KAPKGNPRFILGGVSVPPLLCNKFFFALFAHPIRMANIFMAIFAYTDELPVLLPVLPWVGIRQGQVWSVFEMLNMMDKFGSLVLASSLAYLALVTISL